MISTLQRPSIHKNVDQELIERWGAGFNEIQHLVQLKFENQMAFLIIIFLVFGVASFFCIVLFAAFHPQIYFKSAFTEKAPKIWGKDAASTDEIVVYYCTKIFLISVVGLISIYLFYFLKG